MGKETKQIDGRRKEGGEGEKREYEGRREMGV